MKTTIYILLILFIISARNSFGQTTFTQIRKISNIGSGNNFGWKVDIDGDYAIAANYHKNATDRGEVYVYYKHQGGYNNWGAVDTLRPNTLINNSWFGTSLAISGTTIMVVAKSSSTIPGGHNGMAYVFDVDPVNCNQWIETGRIISPTGSSGQWLGVLNADLYGDVAVLGNFSFPSWQGMAAQIYYRNQGGANNWGRVTTITSSDFDNGDGFSWDVHLSGDDLIVGAYLANNGGSRNGAAYIFSRNQGGANNWGQVRKIIASDGAFDDDFGISVAIDGDIAVVGAQANDNANGTDAGAAYIYGRNQGGVNNWGQIRKIIGSNTAAGDLFGQDVTIYNDLILVNNNQNEINSYLFQQNFGGTNNWGETQIISATPAPGAHWYGHDAALTSEAIIIGDPNDNGQAGAIYFHSSISVDTPIVCNNITNENLNTLFAPLNSNLWVGQGVYNDSLLNATGLTGVYEYIAVSGPSSCDSIRRYINFVPSANATFTTSDFCSAAGHSVTITGTTGGVFSFSPIPSDGATINTTTGVISNFTIGNSYTIKYVVGVSCPDSSYQTVNVLNNTVTSISDTVCLGDSLLFNNIYVSDTGVYYDTLTASNSCDSVIELTLYIDSTLPNIICVSNQTDTITSEDCQYTIQDYTSLISLTSASICGTSNYVISQTPSMGTIVTVSSNTSIPIQITAVNSIVNDTLYCNFDVNVTCENPLLIPEFISPNGDGKNDTWFIDGLNNFGANNVKIFNRYGSLVYSIDDYPNNWGGEVNNTKSISLSGLGIVPSGTYFYILEFPNEELIYTGIIQVMK